MLRTLVLLLISAVTVFATACDRAADPPRPGPDAARVVVLAPALGVILRDLGLEDEIVGKHAWDMALDSGVPAVGTHDDPDLESIVRLNPTHVIVQDMESRGPESLRRAAERHGWLLWGYPLLTLDDIAAAADDLNTRLNDTPDAAPPSERLELAWADRGEPARAAGRVLLLAGVDPAGALGPGSFHHQLLERMGATPALTTGGPWQELDHEDILRLNPDAVLLFRPGVADAGSDTPLNRSVAMDALGGIAGLDIAAVRAGRVGVIDHPLGLLPATSLAEVAAQIARVLDEWAE